MAEKYNYIEQAFSVTKQDTFSPWKIVYSHPFDVNKKVSIYIADRYALADTSIDNIQVVEAGEDLKYILDFLVDRIADKYPYQWPLEGQKIDNAGYDFRSNFNETAKVTVFDIVPSAKTIAWEKCRITPPIPMLERSLTQKEYVKGQFVTKLSIVLGKPSPISTFSIDLYAAKPMELLSLVYEEDTMNYHQAKKINLDYVAVLNDNYTLTIKLAQPIFAKRLTLVFAQNNAQQNSYQIVTSNPESLLYKKEVQGSNPFGSLSGQWENTTKESDLLISKKEFEQSVIGFEQKNIVGKTIGNVLSLHNDTVKGGGN